MSARPDGYLTIGQAAQRAGTTAVVIRAWSQRYGWPMPSRDANGYRLFSEREVQAICWVRSQQSAGRELGDILANGSPQVPSQTPAEPRSTLTFLADPPELSPDAQQVRRRLITALHGRDLGIIRWALAYRDRLRPRERELAVDGVIRWAEHALGSPAWLRPILEPTHVF